MDIGTVKADGKGITKEDVVAEARTWLETRWQHQARLKGVAADCGGMILGVLWSLGYTDFDWTRYGRIPDGLQLRRICETVLEEIPLSDAREGDVFLMRFSEHPQHVGIFGRSPDGALTLIHSYATARKVVEQRLDEDWRQKLVAAYRLRGMES